MNSKKNIDVLRITYWIIIFPPIGIYLLLNAYFNNKNNLN